jgi:TonB family protein
VLGCVVFVVGLSLQGAGQDAPRVQPLDCEALLAAPLPGVQMLCDGEEAMRRAAASTADERARLWRAAADAYAQSVNQLQALEHRIHALEMLVHLNGPAHLRNPDAVEQALRGLVQMEPGRPEPALRLATFQEERERFEAAEETLLFARQAHQDSLDLMRELAKFYARRVLAVTPKDEDGKPVIAPAPEPAWKPDCAQVTFGAPGPGIGELCQAIAEMQMALSRPMVNPAAPPPGPELTRKERLAHMENAARRFRGALSSVREAQQKVYVYEALARLYGSANLGQPQQAESAVRDWIALEPRRVEPILRLALVQEDMKQPHVAEQTLVSVRQLYPDEIEVMKALSRFFARQASAASMIASRAETEKEPAPAPNQPDADGNYRVGSGVRAPRRLVEESPHSEYPDEARAVGLEGTVIMELWVDETGRVTRARMLRGIPMLEDAAIAAVMQWRFEPVIVSGKAVPVRMTVTHGFTLR